MEVLTALGDAENDLYSANFADYSGGGGTKVSRLKRDACARGLRTVTDCSIFLIRWVRKCYRSTTVAIPCFYYRGIFPGTCTAVVSLHMSRGKNTFSFAER